MMNEFHGIEEYIPKPEYISLFQQALKEAEQDRNRKIVDSIKGLLAELKEVENQIKTLQKKKHKIEGKLKGYSKGQVETIKNNENNENDYE